MKKNQLIIKAIMALALMMCGSNLAYAQFGSLKNVIKREATKQVNDAKRQATHDILREKNEAERKEREAAKQKAEAAVSETTGVSTNTGAQTENGEGISVWYGNDNTLVGTYFPDRKEFELVTKHKDGPREGKPITYTFHDDGAIMGDDGKQKGEIKGNMVSSGNVYNMEVKSDGIVMWDGEELGEISSQGNVRLFNSAIARTSEPMDSKILAFCVYGVLYKTDKLRELRKEKDNPLGGYTIKRTVVTKPSGDSSSGETILYKGGSIVGKIKADGTVYVGGSIKGQIRSNGSIYVGGSNSGTLRPNGDVLRSGSIIGRIEDNGNIRIKGSIVGKVESNGDIRKGGSIVGKAKNMTNMRHAAIFYFFGFY